MDLITKWFNGLQKTILQEERDLIVDQLKAVDEKLKPSLTLLTWQVEDLESYIEEAKELVYKAHCRVLKAKQNVEIMQSLMNRLHGNSFVMRKNGKISFLLVRGEKGSTHKLHIMAKDVGQNIQELLQHNQQVFEAEPLSDKWKAYTEYIDRMILEGLCKAVKCSLQYLIDNTESSLKNAPLFEVELVLNGSEMTFMPSLNPKISGNFLHIIANLLKDVYQIASCIPRVAEHLGKPTYQQDVDEMESLKEMHREIISRVHSTIVNVKEYQRYLKKYSYLWMDDKTEFMKQFLLYGRFLSTEEMELYADYELQKCSPQLEHFKKQINFYESLFSEVGNLENEETFNGWLRVNVKPFKLSLMNIIKKWSWMFQNHLLNHVTCSGNELEEFIEHTEKGLAKKVNGEGYSVLLEIMGHLMAIRDRQSTDENFRHLKATAELLRFYGQLLPDQIYSQLENVMAKFQLIQKATRRENTCNTRISLRFLV